MNEPEVMKDLRERFSRDYNYTELYYWERNHLNWSENLANRSLNPIDILNNGQGKCGEFAILYVALCKAHGYQVRLVVNTWGNHEWAEVKIEDNWVHVDPSLSPKDTRKFNDPKMYQRDWNAFLLLVLAFDNSSIINVTPNYRYS